MKELGKKLTSVKTKEQAREIIIAYCSASGIKVGTKRWDYLIRDLFFCFNSWFDEMEEMDAYMSQF